MIKKIDQIARPANVSAESADRLRQGSDLNIYTPVHSKMIDGATALAAEHAGRVRVVHHHDRAVLLGSIAQTRQRTDVAIHRENAIRDQQLPPRLTLHAGQLL